MPFGLTTAPNTFQRAMNLVLGSLKGGACIVYLDDILILGASWSEHLENLGKVLTVLYSAGFV